MRMNGCSIFSSLRSCTSDSQVIMMMMMMMMVVTGTAVWQIETRISFPQSFFDNSSEREDYSSTNRESKKKDFFYINIISLKIIE
jgi:hypothetical protein